MPETKPVDTPIPQPPTRLENVKGFIGDLARPFSIIATSYAAAHATIVIANRVDGFEGAAVFIGAVFFGLGALYWGKSWEVAKTGGQAASVQVVQAATAPVAPVPADPSALPPWERQP